MWLSNMYFLLIGQALWDVKTFDTVKRRKSDGRTQEHGYTISFSAQADLKRLFNTCIFFFFQRCGLMLNVSDVANVSP